MKTINKAKIFAATALLGFGLSSCSDWLDVKMEDQVMENTLFSNYSGYLAALNGAYVSMNALYSTTYTVSGLDVMAQYYNVTSNNDHKQKLFSSYSYTDTGFETYNNAIWSKAYEIIADINVVIERCNGDNPLTAKQRAIILGEALALRGYLHLDLLRLYGPIYSEDPNAACIPYQSSSSREIQPLLPASEVLTRVIDDLKAGAALLKDYDPIITEGVKNTSIEDDGLSSYDMSLRQLRMNYYAVEALLARAYLWGGDKAEAYNIAKNEIIDKIATDDLVVFPWTTRAQVTAETAPDRIFSSEVFFALYNSKRYDMVQAAFFAETLTPTKSRLTFYGENMTTKSKITTFYDDDNDLRRTLWEVVEPTDEEKAAASVWSPATTSLVLTKYKDFSGTAMYRYMIPLIRLGEVYLIAAEAAPTETEGRTFLNTLRQHRDCQNIAEEADFGNALTFEMAREVIGEGQLFYFYKRRGATELIGGTGDTWSGYIPQYSMNKTNYVWPLPQSESNKRLTNNK